MSKFWLYDPSILLKKDKMLEFWPKEDLNMAEKLNAVTRTILVLTTLGYISRGRHNVKAFSKAATPAASPSNIKIYSLA